MSLIDDIFAQIPAPLMQQWGETITYIKTTTPRTYNPTTGAVTGDDVTVTLKAIVSPVNIRESEGLYQASDVKFLIGVEDLGTYYPTEADRIRYTQAGVTREAKIINVRSYRGENPVIHTIIARPQ